jgi:hypothetical protein
MTTIALRSEFKKEKVTPIFFVRSHFVNNLRQQMKILLSQLVDKVEIVKTVPTC